MKNFFFKKNLLTLLFFLSIFALGSLIFNDYGISIDEDNSRVNGFVSLKYILELLNSNLLIDLNNVLSVPSIHSYTEQGNGVVFETPLALIEILFKIENTRDIYLLRHYLTFLIFYVFIIFFFLLLKKRFNSILLASLGVLFLVLSPRIFAQSFYNSKDIIFMSLNFINLYFGIKYLEKSNLRNGLIFAIFSGLSVGIRLLGIYLTFIVLILRIIQILRSNDNFKKQIFNFLATLLLIFFFIYLFWPYLWADPISNFYEAFHNIGNHKTGLYNFFLSEYTPAIFVPWYYVFVWVGITTPLVYLILFLLGIFFVFKRIIVRIINIEQKKTFNDLWRGNKEKIDFLIFLGIFLPSLIIIVMHSSLYTGWRHMYFIYPFLIYFSVYLINLANILYFKKNKYLFFLIFISIIPTFIWMIKNHPFQYVYFNSIVKKNFNKFFEMDYWGVSNYHSLEYILSQNRNKEIIYVGILGNGDLNLSKNFLSNEDKKKLVITSDLNKADFLVDNFARWNGDYKFIEKLKIENKYKIYYQIKVNEVAISSIYTNTFK